MCWLRLWAARLPLTENATCFKTAHAKLQTYVCVSTQLSLSVWLCLCVCFIFCVCICICDSLCLLNIWWCQCECRFRWSVGVFLCAIFQKNLNDASRYVARRHELTRIALRYNGRICQWASVRLVKPIFGKALKASCLKLLAQPMNLCTALNFEMIFFCGVWHS